MNSSIVLVRHGETEWNHEHIFRGHSDIPLNNRGLEQARITGEYLQKLDFAAVYCSPLARARQTATAISLHHGLEPHPCDGLVDISFGPWEGKSSEELDKIYPEEMSIWKREPEKLRLEGVETLEQVRKRAFDEMQKLVKANRGGSIAIVSHRVILKLLLLSMLNLGSDYFWKIRQNSCCVNRIEHSETDGFIILTVNETCHLK